VVTFHFLGEINLDTEEKRRKARDYYQQNKEKLRARREEKISCMTKEELALFKEKEKEKNRNNYQKNKSRILETKKRNREKFREEYNFKRREQRKSALEKPTLYLKKYGITKEDFDKMLEIQQGVCAICSNQERGKRLSVDHCHKTGKVRGLLCSSCNTSLGRFNDDTKIMLKAISYIEKYRD